MRQYDLLRRKDLEVAKLVDDWQAADMFGLDRGVFRKLVRSSNNPPPFLRPSERTMLFDIRDLQAWRETWKTINGKAGA
jgi:hypothetical protein